MTADTTHTLPSTSSTGAAAPSSRHADRRLEALARMIRRSILISTTHAGSGHPSSSLSAVELMTGLLFGGTFRYDLEHHEHPNNDRLIFSKGHASPLYYALWLAAGHLTESDLLRYRRFGSDLEGHPTPSFPLVEAATGSLGQGLSIGMGMALNAKYLDQLPYRTYVLLGDSEMAEGSQWEAMELAAHYQLDNLVGVLDVNRLGQCGETMLGHDLAAYDRRIRAFGWDTLCLEDGHDLPAIVRAFERSTYVHDRPTMILARTFKGRGVSLMEDKEGWHGKVLSPVQCEAALLELGEVDTSVRGELAHPADLKPLRPTPQEEVPPQYDRSRKVATRAAFGRALNRIYPKYPQMVVLDAEVGNSTHAEQLRHRHPERYFEMFIAEQNMVGAALGLSRRGKIPFISTFAAFLTRAFDQIRMARYSGANLKFVGSHAGVSIGEDGPSQMGLEDVAMFRTLLDSVVLHPCDAIATDKLVEEMARHVGLSYLRTLRQPTPILYHHDDAFPIGGSKVLRRGEEDLITVVAAGATVHEALEAHATLLREGRPIRVIDAYSIKPLDVTTLNQAAAETRRILTVEDHYAEGGLGEAVAAALSRVPTPVVSMAVRRTPHSGRPEELRRYEEVSASAIVDFIRNLPCA